MRRYFVYIVASRSRVLYVSLVYFEETNYVFSALEREKEIKAWRREKKVDLIESGNPTWQDLSYEWYDSNLLKADPSLRSG